MKTAMLASTSALVLVSIAALSGCGDSSSPTADAGSARASDARPEWLLVSAPETSMSVKDARDIAQGGETIALRGIIGGRMDALSDGAAAFLLVDESVPNPCVSDGDDHCKTPWDYCCTQDQVKTNIATVKVVDESGKPVTDDARHLLGVKELSTVVIQGKATRDDQGNLTIAATKAFVRPSE